jgi:hypothetical protein
MGQRKDIIKEVLCKVILKNKGHMIDGVRVSENTAMKY